MNSIIRSLLAITLLMSATGCAHKVKYPNWEYVRIENSVPSSECKYKIQDACHGTGADCFNTYKQRAVTFDANTVVLTMQNSSQTSSGRLLGLGTSVGGNSSSKTETTYLADFYSCPVGEK